MTKIRIALSKVASRVEENGLKWRRKDVKCKKTASFSTNSENQWNTVKSNSRFLAKISVSAIPVGLKFETR